MPRDTSFCGWTLSQVYVAHKTGAALGELRNVNSVYSQRCAEFIRVVHMMSCKISLSERSRVHNIVAQQSEVSNELKVLRRSTSNAQLTMVPCEIVAVILEHASFECCTALPCVCTTLVKSSGSTLQRMPIMSRHVFNELEEHKIKAHKRPYTRGVVNSWVMRDMKRLRFVFMVDESVPLKLLTSAEQFERVALRAAEYRSEFKRIKAQMKTDFVEMMASINEAREIIDLASLTSTSADMHSASDGGLVRQFVAKMVAATSARVRVREARMRLCRLNTQRELLAVIPSLLFSVDCTACKSMSTFLGA